MLDAVEWLGEHEGATVKLLPVDAIGRVDPADLRAALEEAAGTVALVSVMWANNEVGTLQPIAELVAECARAGVPMHSDATQAAGHVPIDFDGSGLAALTLAGHKFGGPQGVGALLIGRNVACVPLAHGGGHERDLRSGTPNVPGVAGMAAALSVATARMDDESVRKAALRDALIAGIRAFDGAVINGGAGHGVPALPGIAHVSFTGCEGDSLLMLLDARGIEAATGSACSAGVARASHVLVAMGADAGRRPRLAAVLLRPQVHRRRRRTVLDALGQVVERARAAGLSGARGPLMRVLAAMSGGVDSAVAAARAVEAGHDVVGVHLALSEAPGTLRTGSRGCCSKEDAGDARRAADVLGHPVLRLGLRGPLQGGRDRRFRRVLRRGRNPEPVPALQREDQVLRAGRARLRPRLRRRRHRPLRPPARTASCAAPSTPTRTSRTSSRCSRRISWPGPCSPSATPRSPASARRPRVAAWPSRTSPTATTSASSRPATPRPSSAPASASAPAPWSTPRPASALGEHAGVHEFTIGQRKGLGLPGPAADGEPRYVTGIDAESGEVRVGRGEQLDVTRIVADGAVWTCGSAPIGPIEATVQVRAHGGLAPVTARAEGDRMVLDLHSPLRGVAPGQAAVLYAPDAARGDLVLGSGTIRSTAHATADV